MDCKNKTPRNQAQPVGPITPKNPPTRLRGFMEMMVKVAKSGDPIPLQRGKSFSCVEELVLRSGRAFTQPQSVQAWKNPFEQALLLAMADMDVIYCEGFAQFEGKSIPELTAWVVHGGKLLVPAEGEFFGVGIDTLSACGYVLETGSAGVLSAGGDLVQSLLDTGFPRGVLVRFK